MRLVIASLVFSASGLFGQASAPRPVFDAFEVATIKPAVDTPGRFIQMQSANRLFARGFTLNALIAVAFTLSPQAISGGPAWAESDKYDILASTPNEVQPNVDEQMSMMRKLLADRFQLAFHRETKELPVYVLAVAKSGSKLKASVAPAGTLPELVNVIYPDEKGGVHVQLPARNASMKQFAAMMQRTVMDRPVLDSTGLAGTYDFDLEWSPEDNQFGGKLPRSAEPSKPSLFAAMQELGIKLEATRGPVSTLVIDRVERPSEN